MTVPVIEVGPETVHGPGSVSRQQVSAALECIDDPLALLDEHVVVVEDLLRDVLRAAAGETAETAVIVVPTWWSSGRVQVVTAAAEGVFSHAVVVTRSILVTRGDATVVELSADHAVITSAASERLVLCRDDVDTHLEAADSVLIDVPEGVRPLSADLITRLRQRGVPLAYNTHHRMRDAAVHAIPAAPRRGVAPPNRRAIAVMAGVAVTGAAVGGGWAAQAFTHPATDSATRLLTEGRVAVTVPASWTVERITAGAGSARVRVAAPGGVPALHITQSGGSAEVTLDGVAETLRSAIESEPSGVFVDFDAHGDRGGRPAVTYVERRAGTETRWAVLVDGATRIAIGCQHPRAQRDLIEEICAQAVLSAHSR